MNPDSPRLAPNPAQVFAHVALLAVAFIYGFNYFIAKAVFAYVPPFGMVAIRTFFAWLFFWVVQRLWVREKIKSRADWLRLALCGLFGAVINQLLFFWGLSETLAVNASVMITTSPVFVLLVAWLLKYEAMTVRKFLGLTLAFGGALWLLLSGRRLQIGEDTLLGDLLVLTNAASYGTYLVLVRPLMLRYHVFTIVAWVFFFGTLVNVPLGLPDLIALDWGQLPLPAWGSIVYIVLFTTISTYSFNAFALQRVPASAVGIYIYLQPVIVALLAWYWQTGGLSPEKLLSMGLVFLGVGIVSYRKKQR